MPLNRIKMATDGHISGQANEPLTLPAHALASDQVAEELQTDTAVGLTLDEVSARLAKYGSNDLGKEKGIQPLQILLAQVANAMTMVSRHSRLIGGIGSFHFGFHHRLFTPASSN